MRQANNNPWLALSTYEERDEYRFKGRDTDIENMLQLIRQNEYVVCYAASGDGKSSLVNAGVCPRIRREGMFPIKIVFTSDEYDGKGIPMLPEGSDVDFDKLILSKIEQNIKAFRDDFAARHGIDEELELGFEKLERYQDMNVQSLWWKLRTETIQIPFGEFDYIPVLIFDQFEEIFRAKWKAEFFKWLEILSKDICPQRLQASHMVSTDRLPGKKLFKMIFSMRCEYVGELDYWCSQRTYIPQIMQNRYFLKPLTRTQAISIIVDQAENDEVTKRIKESSDRIVDHIVEGCDKHASSEIPAIVLSLICYVLYDEWAVNEAFPLNSISLNELVYNYYKDQLTRIGMTDEHRNVLEDVLISQQNTRLRVAVIDSRLQAMDIARYLDDNSLNIASLHLVRIVNVDGEKYLEFIHDKLVEAISKYRDERKQRENDEENKVMRRKYIVMRRKYIMMWLLLLTALLLVAVFVYMFVEIRQQRNGMLISQSRFVSEKAMELYENGECLRAMALMTEVYPHDLKNPDRPLTQEAYSALRAIRGSCSAIKKFLHGHTDRVTSASYSPDGHHIVTSSWDSTAIIWNSETGNQECVLRGHDGYVASASYSPDGRHIVTSSYDGTTIIWDAETGEQECILRDNGYAVLSAVYSPDGRHIVTSSPDGTAIVWDAETGEQERVLCGHDGYVTSASYSPDGRLIVTTSYWTAIIWEAETGEQKSVLRGHNDVISSAAYSPDGLHIVTSSYDGTIIIWNAETGDQESVLRGHVGDVLSAAYSPDGRHIVTSSLDKTAIIWEVEIAEQKSVLCHNNRDNRVNSAAYSPDGHHIVSSSLNETIIWEAETGKQESVLIAGHINSASYSPDCRHIVTSGYYEAIIWDAMTGGREIALLGHDGEVLNTVYSPDGRHVVTSSWDSTAIIWDAETGKQEAVLLGHDGIVYSVAYSPDGHHIVTSSSDNTAIIWDAKTGEQECVLRGHADGVTSASYSPDCRRIATSSYDGTAIIWDAMTGGREIALIGHDNVVSSAVYSPDCRYIVTSSWDKTAIIWDAITGEQECVLRGHTDRVTSASYSPDGRHIVTSSGDGTAIIWDAETGKQECVLRHDGAVRSATYSPDGRQIMTLVTNNRVRIWYAPDPQGLIDETLDILNGYRLSPDERRWYYLD